MLKYNHLYFPTYVLNRTWNNNLYHLDYELNQINIF